MAFFASSLSRARTAISRSRIQELIRQHEIGHCLGWPADHPGARSGDSPQPKQQLHPQPSKLVLSPAPRRPCGRTPLNAALRRGTRRSLSRRSRTARLAIVSIGSSIWQAETVTCVRATSPISPSAPTLKCRERKLAMTYLHASQHQSGPPRDPHHRSHVLTTRRFSLWRHQQRARRSDEAGGRRRAARRCPARRSK